MPDIQSTQWPAEVRCDDAFACIYRGKWTEAIKMKVQGSPASA